MRTKSIISIIRRYGLSSKRLNPKNRIKYEDAIKGLEGYENSELKIVKVVDNQLFPSKSVSCKCQIPGCNHKIRYEYILENKESHDRMVAGSTCVWPTLGLSEIQKKEFLTYEKVVKEYHDMLQWRQENPDVVAKLFRMKSEKLNQFRPFWEEAEHCRLMDEDTEYIRSTDVDKIIKARDERERQKAEYRRMTEEQRRKSNEEYQKVLEGLETLRNKYPENHFYASLSATAKNYRLSKGQIRCIKIGCNKLWYEEHIKNTPKNQVYESCDEILKSVLSEQGYQKDDLDSVKHMNEWVATQNPTIKLAWSLFKVKHEVVL